MSVLLIGDNYEREVFLVLVSGTLGTAIGSQFPTAGVKAAEVGKKSYTYRANANPTVTTQVESGIGSRALGFVNNRLNLVGNEALSFTPDTQCPLETIELNWEIGTKTVSIDGGSWAYEDECKLRWRIKTTEMDVTTVYSAPQR